MDVNAKNVNLLPVACSLSLTSLCAQRLKKKMKSGATSAADMMSQEDKWTSQIIVADVIFYQAVLTFINQDIPSYVKGMCSKSNCMVS